MIVSNKRAGWTVCKPQSLSRSLALSKPPSFPLVSGPSQPYGGRRIRAVPEFRRLQPSPSPGEAQQVPGRQPGQPAARPQAGALPEPHRDRLLGRRGQPLQRQLGAVQARAAPVLYGRQAVVQRISARLAQKFSSVNFSSVLDKFANDA